MTISAEKPTSRFELLDPLRERPVRLLWGAQAISEIGDWASRLALAAVVFAATSSPWWSALTYVATLLPQLGLGQYLSAHAERLSCRTVLVGADLIRAVIFALAWVMSDTPVVLLALAFLSGVASAPFNAVRNAAMAEMPSTEKRQNAALTLSGLTQDVSVVFGYLLGGVLLVTLGPSTALGLNALTFVLSGALLLGLPDAVSGGKHKASENLRAAVRTLTSTPTIWLPAGLGTLAAAVASAIESLVVSGVSLAYPAIGWLPGGVLVAVALCTVVLVPLLRPQDRAGAGRIAVVVAVVSLLVIAASLLARPGMLAAFVLSGAMFVALTMAAVTIAPQLGEQRATCFSILGGSLVAAQTALTALAGALATLTSASWAIAILSSLSLAAGLAGWKYWRSLAHTG